MILTSGPTQPRPDHLPREIEVTPLKNQHTFIVYRYPRVMDLREILAEKLRAASGRARYRDFYDIAMILDTHQMDFGEILDLVRQKEIRTTISQESMLRNWEIAKQEKGKGVGLIVYAKEISEEKIQESVKSIGPLKIRKPR